MRCLALADALGDSGWTCAFACTAETATVVPSLSRSGHPSIPIDMDSSSEPATLIRNWPQGCDLLIVDHYHRDIAFESSCRPWAQRIMVIDDLADRRHDCDLLLDQTFGQREEIYRPYVPTDCNLLLGSQFALLRAQFAGARMGALKRRRGVQGVRRILVSLGASDPDNVTRTVLEGIAQSGANVAVDVVLGAASLHGQTLRKTAENMVQPVELHGQVTDMANLMAQADLAIGAAGTSTWERCCLGLPSLVVIFAENQALIAEQLERAGAARILGWRDGLTPAAVAGAVSTLVENGGELRAISERATQLCDGRGTLRALCALLPYRQARDGKAVSLRLASAADTDIMFRWQSDDRTRRFARTSRSPTRDAHETWMQATLADASRILCLILHGQVPAGVLRLDRDENSMSYEISILVDPDRYGLGIASAALSLGRALLPGASLVAEVLPENTASHNLFLRAGYRPIDARHYVSEPQPTS